MRFLFKILRSSKIPISKVGVLFYFLLYMIIERIEKAGSTVESHTSEVTFFSIKSHAPVTRPIFKGFKILLEC